MAEGIVMEHEVIRRADSNEVVFMFKFQPSDMQSMTKEVLIDRMANMANTICEKLVADFVEAHREEVLRHVHITDMIADVRAKCGDRLVEEILKVKK